MAPIQSKLKVLIIDDEKRACTNLKNILIEYVDPTINIVGLAYTTQEAEEYIISCSPDAVFLDIEMTNENAFDFLHRISPINFEVIFVTAFDEYAVRAFKLNAIDYILKPISILELKNAVQKLKEKLKFKKIIAENTILYNEISSQVANKAKHHSIKLNGPEIIDFRDIYFIEAQSSYSRFVINKDRIKKEIIMSYPLSDYEEILPVSMFFRIHRSYLINCIHIKKILNDENCFVKLNSDITLPVSRRRYPLLLEFLKNNDYLL